ncbi:MAG TPA: sulfurase [Casimicrobiaceae bacterium]|nr:sulfurase [Casimicrobiaceae bacterium]
MTVIRIFVRQSPGSPQTGLDRATVLAGAGIEGDRYFGCRDEPGQNVTLVEAEEIEAFTAENRRPIDFSITGRNLVTRGIRLNQLVGREFMVGDVRLRGVELCEPCLGLGDALASQDLPASMVVRRLVHRAGLRADALSSGVIAVGARIATVV